MKEMDEKQNRSKVRPWKANSMLPGTKSTAKRIVVLDASQTSVCLCIFILRFLYHNAK